MWFSISPSVSPILCSYLSKGNPPNAHKKKRMKGFVLYLKKKKFQACLKVSNKSTLVVLGYLI